MSEPADGTAADGHAALPDADALTTAVADPGRLSALRGTGLLDTGPEEAFDRLTRLASELLDVPVSLISLVDGDRQYFKSAVGLVEPWRSTRETPLSHSVCQYVVAKDGAVAIEDTHEVAPLEDNRAVTELGVTAYAGVPLRGDGGDVYGAFCVIDGTAREWTPAQIAILEDLGAAAAGEIELRQQLAHALRHDRLTGLPNREQFAARVAKSLAATTELVGVVVVDVSNLAAVNDSLGKRTGDKLLVAVASRLAAALSHALVARIADDLFGVLTTSVTGEREALRCVDACRELLTEPFEIEEDSLHLSPSVGLALGDRTDDGDELVAGAITALRQARRDPHDLRALGGSRRRDDAIERLRTENALRLAIQNGALHVFYQPKFNLGDRRLVGFEALLRWDDPVRGRVPPSTFIPIAEACGLIASIGQFVLGEACRQAAAWSRDFPGLDVGMAVNLSPRQMQVSDIARLIEDALSQTGLAPDRLTLEITESALMERSSDQLALLNALAAMGVSIDLDDFGVGYSSLSYLASLPLDALKIDRSFVSGMGEPRVDAIVQATLSLAAALGLGVTAEGIETDEQLDQLLAMGCNCGQGYLLSHPLSPAALVGLLTEAAAAPSAPRRSAAPG